MPPFEINASCFHLIVTQMKTTPFHVYKPFEVPSINLTIQLPDKRWKKTQEYIRNWQLTKLCAIVNHSKQQHHVLEVLYTYTRLQCAQVTHSLAQKEGVKSLLRIFEQSHAEVM